MRVAPAAALRTISGGRRRRSATLCVAPTRPAGWRWSHRPVVAGDRRPVDEIADTVRVNTQPPAHTPRESRTRPSGIGAALCWCAAICFAIAAFISISVWVSPEFGGDFDSGARTAPVSGEIGVAAGLVVAGAVADVAAIVRGGGHRVRAVGVLLLLLAGPAAAILTLPLWDFYR